VNRPTVYLASASPRRAELLTQIGIRFNVRLRPVDEIGAPSDPMRHVTELALRKATAAARELDEGVVIGADTVVFENAILGKPKTRNEALGMLLKLSGRTHSVFTGICLIRIGSPAIVEVEQTQVRFRIIEPWEAEAYVRSGSPMDKAGAYGIQDRAGSFVERIEGCYYNVMGLPLSRLCAMFRKALGDDYPILWSAP
jgi:septum formation protein